MAEQMVNCPTCGGSGVSKRQVKKVDKDGKTSSETVYENCKDCDGMGVIPGGPPVP